MLQLIFRDHLQVQRFVAYEGVSFFQTLGWWVTQRQRQLVSRLGATLVLLCTNPMHSIAQTFFREKGDPEATTVATVALCCELVKRILRLEKMPPVLKYHHSGSLQLLSRSLCFFSICFILTYNFRSPASVISC